MFFLGAYFIGATCRGIRHRLHKLPALCRSWCPTARAPAAITCMTEHRDGHQGSALYTTSVDVDEPEDPEFFERTIRQCRTYYATCRPGNEARRRLQRASTSGRGRRRRTRDLHAPPVRARLDMDDTPLRIFATTSRASTGTAAEPRTRPSLRSTRASWKRSSPLVTLKWQQVRLRRPQAPPRRRLYRQGRARCCRSSSSSCHVGFGLRRHRVMSRSRPTGIRDSGLQVGVVDEAVRDGQCGTRTGAVAEHGRCHATVLHWMCKDGRADAGDFPQATPCVYGRSRHANL